MRNGKMRVLLLCDHPTQYGSPMFRLLATHRALEVRVAYCSLQGAESHMDTGFGVPVGWDIPLLDGYPWMKLKDYAPRFAKRAFFGPVSPTIWRLIRSRQFEAVVAFTGYMCATFWIALMAAKLSQIPILFGTDAHALDSADSKKWKIAIKKIIWPKIFGLADVAFAPSSGTLALMHSLGLPPHRVALAPYVVCNEWWTEKARQVDRDTVRRKWEIPSDAPVVLYCAKFQSWKRPLDLLHAFTLASVPETYLVFAGDGRLRKEVEAEARRLGVHGQVRFLGFVNQSGLPEIYCASDLLVLPSSYEAFGLVVNEAMICGVGAVVSDKVGARFDLVREGETGFVYPCGDIEALSTILKKLLGDKAQLRRIGAAAQRRIAEWSPELYVESIVGAVAQARRLRTTPTSTAASLSSLQAP